MSKLNERNIVGFVFARGGSKGVPRKNVRPINGVPLIGHAINAAKAVPEISRIVVSTDDVEIADVARQYGADVPFLRPATLATDSASEWMAWRHAIDEIESRSGKIDLFVSVPAVCPLRTSDDITACIDRFDRGDADLVLTVVPAPANPYYTLVEYDAENRPYLCKTPQQALKGRQQAPKVDQIVAGCYVTRPDFIRNHDSIWGGRLRTVEIPPQNGIDIDTEIDFALAEVLMGRRPNQSGGKS